MALTSGAGHQLPSTRSEHLLPKQRPSQAELCRITQGVYKRIHENDLFRLETADQTYCEDDKLFLADRFVEGTCPNCGYDVSRHVTRYLGVG